MHLLCINCSACKVGFITEFAQKNFRACGGEIHLYCIPYSTAVYFTLILNSVPGVHWSHFLNTNTRSGP